MTEADKPRPLGEHLARAHDIHRKLCDFARSIRKLDTEDAKVTAREQLVTLRESAAKGFWLYPVVEARMGEPR